MPATGIHCSFAKSQPFNLLVFPFGPYFVKVPLVGLSCWALWAAEIVPKRLTTVEGLRHQIGDLCAPAKLR